MKKRKVNWRILLISLLLLSACSTYTIKDNRVRVHYIEQGEVAPFSGVLLNEYTYYRLKNLAKEGVDGRKK